MMPKVKVEDDKESWAIRIEDAPKDLHKKIEIFQSRVHGKEKKKLTKGQACVRLLTKATENITL